jgi:hypothetical protein
MNKKDKEVCFIIPVTGLNGHNDDNGDGKDERV